MAVILIRHNTVDENIANAEPVLGCNQKKEGFLCDKCPKKAFAEFKGGSFEFFFIEIMVYTCYIVSMLLYMIRSRFTKVGEDVGSQFEGIYMKLTANKIANLVDLSVPKPSKYYKDTERIVVVGGAVEVKMILSRQSIKAIE